LREAVEELVRRSAPLGFEFRIDLLAGEDEAEVLGEDREGRKLLVRHVEDVLDDVAVEIGGEEVVVDLDAEFGGQGEK